MEIFRYVFRVLPLNMIEDIRKVTKTQNLIVKSEVDHVCPKYSFCEGSSEVFKKVLFINEI